MNSLPHEIENHLKSCLKSIRLSFISFFTTVVLDGIILYMNKFFNLSKNTLFISLTIDTLICIFTGINFLIMGVTWIYHKCLNHHKDNFTASNHNHFIIYLSKLILSNSENTRDILKVYSNRPNPTSLIYDNCPRFLRDKGLIKENTDMLPNSPLEKIFTLTSLGKDACEIAFSVNNYENKNKTPQS